MLTDLVALAASLVYNTVLFFFFLHFDQTLRKMARLACVQANYFGFRNGLMIILPFL